MLYIGVFAGVGHLFIRMHTRMTGEKTAVKLLQKHGSLKQLHRVLDCPLEEETEESLVKDEASELSTKEQKKQRKKLETARKKLLKQRLKQRQEQLGLTARLEEKLAEDIEQVHLSRQLIAIKCDLHIASADISAPYLSSTKSEGNGGSKGTDTLSASELNDVLSRGPADDAAIMKVVEEMEMPHLVQYLRRASVLPFS